MQNHRTNQNTEVVLTLSAQGFSISGLVVHRDTNEPVEGMAMMLVAKSEGGKQFPARTGAQGNYTIPDVVAGSYTLFGFVSGSAGVSIPPEQNGRQVILIDRDVCNVNFEAVSSLTVKGIVQTMSGQPVSNANITLQHEGAPKVLTNAQGNFEYQAPPGSILIASHPTDGFGISDPVQPSDSEEPNLITIVLQVTGT